MMKRWICVALALGLLLLCGCKSQKKLDKQVHDALRGSWTTQVPCSDRMRLDLLENIDLDEKELALVSVDGPKLSKCVRFGDGAYSFGIDTAAVRENVRSFYGAVFAQLYENRTALNELYGETFDDMSQEDFMIFYAQLYGCADDSAMLDRFADEAFDYEAMAELEAGTYTAEDEDLIRCIPEGGSGEGTLIFSVTDDQLRIAFSDGEEVYTKEKNP